MAVGLQKKFDFAAVAASAAGQGAASQIGGSGFTARFLRTGRLSRDLVP